MQQTDSRFAERGKELCGIVKLINNQSVTTATVFVANADVKTFGQWWLLLNVCGNEFVYQLDTLNNANLTLPDTELETVACLLVKREDVCYEVARASVGNHYLCDTLRLKMDRLVANPPHYEQPSPSEYEKFISTADNYYDGVDVSNLQAKANARYQSVKDYSTAFDKFYASGGNADYYNSVQSQIVQVFVQFPPYYPLIRKYKQSFFVRIDFPSSDKFFVLGVLQDEGKIRYICYGLPIDNDDVNDKDFVLVECEPVNFYMLFQDADNGQITVLK